MGHCDVWLSVTWQCYMGHCDVCLSVMWQCYMGHCDVWLSVMWQCYMGHCNVCLWCMSVMCNVCLWCMCYMGHCDVWLSVMWQCYMGHCDVWLYCRWWWLRVVCLALMAGCRMTKQTPTSSHLTEIRWCWVPSEYSVDRLRALWVNRLCQLFCKMFLFLSCNIGPIFCLWCATTVAIVTKET